MYRIDFNEFFSSAFSVDCMLFGYSQGQIKTLLIKRAMEPFDKFWAIPGDLVYPDEDLDAAANRILNDLTGLKNVSFHQAQTFGNPNRHPQGRVITISYFALVRIDDFEATASSWADEISWIPIHEIPNLAFDHNLILSKTIELLKQKLHTEPICFDMLSDRFTLNEFQQLYEYAFEQELDKANFRKKIKYMPLLAHDEKQINVKHRPAKLFSFDIVSYKKLVQTNDYQFKM